MSRFQEFIDRAESNTKVGMTCSQFRGRIVEIHDLYYEIGDALSSLDEERLPLLWFILMAGSAWAAGTRTVLGGQQSDAHPQFRASLEYAAYALHLQKHPGDLPTWLNRHQPEGSEQAVRNTFTAGALKTAAAQAGPVMLRVFTELYDRTIAFGAHPNERALFSRLKVERADGYVGSTLLLQTDDVRVIEFGLKTGCQAGSFGLAAAAKLFPERLRISGITDRIEQLLKGL